MRALCEVGLIGTCCRVVGWGGGGAKTVTLIFPLHLSAIGFLCLSVCVCACVRACVCVCFCLPNAASLTEDGGLEVEQSVCQDFCDTTLELAGVRQSILHDVRQSSMASRLLAEVFDRQRGTSQDSKVAALYERKTCAGVIAGVDREYL